MKVAILGLGIIGSAWARNLLADGLDVRCWNRTPREFPQFHESILDAVGGVQFVIIVVSDPAAVQDVLNQIEPLLSPDVIVIQSSTISAKWSRKFAAQVAARGAQFLEAPFTGSKPAAEQRKTVFYVGGEKPTINAARPLLDRLSSAILHIGPVGSASSLKLAMNLNVAGVAQALTESLALCRAEGIHDDTYFAALHLNASHSGVSDLKEPKLRSRDYTPQFSIKHMAKDLRLGQETAADAKISLALTQKVVEIYEQGLNAGWAEDDFISLIRLIGSDRR